MNNYIEVGKIINTFGIKGELKIVSDFEYKEKIFTKDFPIYIGELKTKEIVSTHRVHKNYDLTTFEGYNNINDVLKYKGNKIYILRSDLNLNCEDYLLSDLIGLKVYDNNILLGVIIDYDNSLQNILLKVKGDKTFYLPMVDAYIKKVDINNKRIETINGSDLIL